MTMAAFAPCALMLAFFDALAVIKIVQKYTPFSADDALELFLSRASMDDIDEANAHSASFTMMIQVAAVAGVMP